MVVKPVTCGRCSVKRRYADIRCPVCELQIMVNGLIMRINELESFKRDAEMSLAVKPGK